MARYTGPKCRLCRREGVKLYLKGERCHMEKCAIERRAYPPGAHGQGRAKRSNYGIQLREKQKVRRTYGVLEQQFRNYYEKASAMKGITGENLLMMLERRLDNVVYRAGLAGSRDEARQLVLHRHVRIGTRLVNVPSFQVKTGMQLVIKDASRTVPRLAALAESPMREPPSWLEVDHKAFTIKVVGMPTRQDVDLPIQESLIVELYSK